MIKLEVGSKIKGIELKDEEFEVVEGGLLKPVRKKFVPKIGKEYSFVNVLGRVDTLKNQDDLMDRWIIKHHPVFETEPEAEEYRQFLELLYKYSYEFNKEEWEDEETSKWFIECIYPDTRLVIVFNSYVKFPLQAYFKTKEDAESFIEESGEEKVKQFMFDIWD